jgi:ParB family chromosome partitioning protein
VAASKFGLGKGLDALLPLEDKPVGKEPGKDGSRMEKVPLDKLRANPNQPRKYFGEAELAELADSIRDHGILEPLIVEDAGDGFYTVVAGERRLRAALLAGLAEVPVLLRAFTDEERMEVTLIENVQRTDLNPIEEASAYKQLMDLTGLSQDEMAAKVGKNRSTVANALRLLKLPQDMREALTQGRLSAGHARALLSLTIPAQQGQLFQKILTEGISVREAEAFTGQDPGEGKASKEKGRRRRDPQLVSIEAKFIETLGTKVAIEGDLAKGCIRIDYYSMEDLDRLYNLLEHSEA